MRRMLTPVRVPVTPDPEAVAALERVRANLRVPSTAILHRDRVQRRFDAPPANVYKLPAALRRQAD